MFLDAGNLRAAQLDIELVDPGAAETVAHGAGVVAAVEMQHADVGEQTGFANRVEGGFEHAHVVTVRAVDRPADRDAVTFRSNRPFPARLPTIGGVWGHFGFQRGVMVASRSQLGLPA